MISSRRELLLVALFFVLLSVAASWPLPTRMGEEIPVSGTPLDAMHLLYGLTWSSQVIGENPLRLFDATFFYPAAQPMAFMDHMVGLAILVAPLNWATGSMIWGYNVAWLLTFVLSGLGAYLLTRYVTESRLAALLAGVLWMLFPFRYHNVGQINVLAMMWIPFALLSLHLWVETRLRRQLFLFLAFALLQFLSSGYSGVFLVLASLIYLAVLLVTERNYTLVLVRRHAWVLLTVLAIGVLVALPFVVPYLSATRDAVGFRRSLGETALYSALPLDLVKPAPHAALGRLAPWGESARHALFPGLIALAMLVVFVVKRPWRGHPRRAEYLFYLWLTGISAVLAMGPVLGDPVDRVPLPFAALWYVLPGASFIRAPVRFAVLASLGIAVLAGAGLAAWNRDRVRRWPVRIRSGVLVGAAALELVAIPVALLDPLPRGVPAEHRWLGSVEGDLAVLELPMPVDEAHESIEHSRYQLYSLVHRKRLVNGVAAFVPPLTRDVRREMQSFPDNGSVARLRHLGVNYVFVHSDLYPPAERAELARRIREDPGLNVVEMDDPIWILDVVPSRYTPAGYPDSTD